MKVFIGILVGVALGIGVYWFISEGREAKQRREFSRQVQDAASSARDSIEEQMQSLDLRPEQIQEELSKTGQVIRRKAKEAGQSISDATTDARITTAVKTKIMASKELSEAEISVKTEKGVVTLTGTVKSQEHIGRAVTMSMDTRDVREVVSKLQVKP